SVDGEGDFCDHAPDAAGVLLIRCATALARRLAFLQFNFGLCSLGTFAESDFVSSLWPCIAPVAPGSVLGAQTTPILYIHRGAGPEASAAAASESLEAPAYN